MTGEGSTRPAARRGRWALLVAGVVLVAAAGVYFAVRRGPVATPTQVAEAYLGEVWKAEPDPGRAARYHCRDGGRSAPVSSPANTIVDWRVTGESIDGGTATVDTRVTIRSSADGQTSVSYVAVTLVKEGRDWKVC